MTRYGTVAWISPPLGSGLVESSSMVWTCVMNGRFPLAERVFIWAEGPGRWRCPPNAPRKQWKDQVAADVTTHLPRRLYRDP